MSKGIAMTGTGRVGLAPGIREARPAIGRAVRLCGRLPMLSNRAAAIHRAAERRLPPRG